MATLTINEFDSTEDMTITETVCEGEMFLYEGVMYAAGQYTFDETDDNGCPFTITLIVNEEDKVTIGNFVWEDLNKNGIQDQGEAGVSDVVITLYECSDESNSGGTMVDMTTSDMNGFYSFEVCPGGSYYIEFNIDGITLPNADQYEFTSQNSGDNVELILMQIKWNYPMFYSNSR